MNFITAGAASLFVALIVLPCCNNRDRFDFWTGTIPALVLLWFGVVLMIYGILVYK